MWGDIERALMLNESDSLIGLLLQITGPLHIPYNDMRWLELLQGYNVWVHVEYYNNNGSSSSSSGDDGEEEENNNLNIIEKVCKLLKNNAIISSNIATFSLHICRMIYDLQISVINLLLLNENKQQQQQHVGSEDNFTRRIELVGKTRVICGSLHLLRVLLHDVMTVVSSSGNEDEEKEEEREEEGGVQRNSNNNSNNNNRSNNNSDYLKDVFTYKSRDINEKYNIQKQSFFKRGGGGGYNKDRSNNNNVGGGENNNDNDNNDNIEVGKLLISSLLSFITCIGCSGGGTSGGGTPASNNNNNNKNIKLLFKSIPELYDVIVFILELLLLLLSSQLYQPMISSTEQIIQIQIDNKDKNNNERINNNYFLDLLMNEATSTTITSTTTRYWTAQSIISTCILWLTNRIIPPSRSISYHNIQLVKSIIQAKGRGGSGSEKISQDGMYESHLIVTACNSNNNNNRNKKGNGNNNNDDDDYNNDEAMMIPQPTTLQRHRSSDMIIDATKGVLMLSSKLILLPFKLMSLALGLWGYKTTTGSSISSLQHHNNYQQYNQFLLSSSSSSSQKNNTRSRKKNRHRHRRLTQDVLWLTDSPISDLSNSLLLLLTNNYRYLIINKNKKNKNKNKSSEIQQQQQQQQQEDGTTSTTSSINPFRIILSSLSDNRWETDVIVNTTTTSSSSSSSNGVVGTTTTTTGAATINDPLLSSTGLDSININNEQTQQQQQKEVAVVPKNVTTNFELLFESFGNIVHTEVGSLLLYTMIQSSTNFTNSLVVRSDLDTLVMPLLRTLYFSSILHYYPQQDYSSSSSKTTLSSSSHQKTKTTTSSSPATLAIKSCPFRSPSQLYVILILLLLFSQDTSFGPDAFRRIRVNNVLWYKERNLKDINLGSVLILTLLRLITFNVNRLQDAFLLSNCCAILMNLSSNAVHIHDYAAMRLASVTISSMKRYCSLKEVTTNNNNKKNNKNNNNNEEEGEEEDDDDEEDITTTIGMYGEVSRTLLRFVKNSLSPKNIETNYHLIYALVYHQSDFNIVIDKCNNNNNNNNYPYKISEYSRVKAVIDKATEIIQSNGDNARTAPKAMNVLQQHINKIKTTVVVTSQQQQQQQQQGRNKIQQQRTEVEHEFGISNNNKDDPSSSLLLSSTSSVSSDFTFSYEEEADPEIFFIPYVWEVIVCVVTSSTIEWEKNCIKVFPILEIDDDDDDDDMNTFENNEGRLTIMNSNNNNDGNDTATTMKTETLTDNDGPYAKDVMDVV